MRDIYWLLDTDVPSASCKRAFVRRLVRVADRSEQTPVLMTANCLLTGKEAKYNQFALIALVVFARATELYRRDPLRARHFTEQAQQVCLRIKRSFSPSTLSLPFIYLAIRCLLRAGPHLSPNISRTIGLMATLLDCRWLHECTRSSVRAMDPPGKSLVEVL